MSNRLVVIPEDIYKSTLSNREAMPKILDDPIDSALISANDELTRILKNPSLSAGEKYAQYNQTLKRIQKLLSERAEKMHEVTLKDIHPRVLTALNEIVVGDKRKKKTAEETQTLAPTEAVESLTRRPTETVESPPQERQEQQSAAPLKAQRVASHRSIASQRTASSQSSSSSQRSLRKSMAADTHERGDRYNALRDLLLANRKEFGISPSNKVINTSGTKEISGSDVDQILNALLGLDTDSRPSGMQTLLNRIMQNSTASQLLTAPPSQTGGGVVIKKVYKRDAAPTISKPLFKPKVWRLY